MGFWVGGGENIGRGKKKKMEYLILVTRNRL